jgi:hypothetical protein|tara:strand:- start:226 stop:399 length:174 start_codon:yes stop_codon:yes gene_type:complete
MFGLKIGGDKPRTAMQIRRELNNAAAENLKNPSPENRQRLEELRQEWNSLSQKKKEK